MSTKNLSQNYSIASYIGIDVSKLKLDWGLLDGSSGVVLNDATGHRALIKKAHRQVNPPIVILEASGGYETSLLTALEKAGIGFRLIHPLAARYFARGIGLLAKNDQIDALMLCSFGATLKLKAKPRAGLEYRQLGELVTLRDLLVEHRKGLKCRAQQTSEPFPAEIIRDQIASFSQQIKKIEAKMQKIIQPDPLMKQLQELFKSQAGVADQTSSVLIALLPELGTLSREKIAALVGLAPYIQESGKWKGRRRCQGGRSRVRKALYMATVTAVRHDAVLMAYYERLVASGKDKKLALIACARKLLIHLNSKAKDILEQNDLLATLEN